LLEGAKAGGDEYALIPKTTILKEFKPLQMFNFSAIRKCLARNPFQYSSTVLLNYFWPADVLKLVQTMFPEIFERSKFKSGFKKPPPRIRPGEFGNEVGIDVQGLVAQVLGGPAQPLIVDDDDDEDFVPGDDDEEADDDDQPEVVVVSDDD